jgi:hypothetical protein
VLSALGLRRIGRAAGALAVDAGAFQVGRYLPLVEIGVVAQQGGAEAFAPPVRADGEVTEVVVGAGRVARLHRLA